MSTETPSLLECFRTNLPNLHHDDRKNLAYKVVKESGKSTSKALPPIALRSRSLQPIIRDAQDGLTIVNREDAILCQKKMMTPFQELSLDTETDLVTASELYMMSPIYEILHCLYPGKWTKHAELTKSDMLDNTEKSLVRFDLVIKTNPERCYGRRDCVVVIEFKRRLQIRYPDFGAACLEPDEDFEEHKKAASDMAGGTYFRGNGIPYMKQICRYASTSQCEYGALFDWDNLLLFKFDKVAVLQKSEATTAGESVDFTWVSEHPDPAGRFIQEGHIREALLGFVLQAFRDASI